MPQALIRNFTVEQVKQKIGSNSDMLVVELHGTLPLVKTTELPGHPTVLAAAALLQKLCDEDAVVTRSKLEKQP